MPVSASPESWRTVKVANGDHAPRVQLAWPEAARRHAGDGGLQRTFHAVRGDGEIGVAVAARHRHADQAVAPVGVDAEMKRGSVAVVIHAVVVAVGRDIPAAAPEIETAAAIATGERKTTPPQ